MSAVSPVPLEIPSQFNIADYFVDRLAREHPERVAILGEPGPTRYGELGEMVNRAGNALLTLGCARGDRVLIVLTDSAEFMAAFFGAAKIGAVAVPVNPFTRSSDYAYYLSDSGARFAVVHEIAWKEFSAALSGARLEAIVLVGAPAGTQREPGILDWTGLRAVTPASDFVPRATRASDTAFF